MKTTGRDCSSVSGDDTSESSSVNVRSSNDPPSKTEDSMTMDILHALHDDKLFSAYLHSNEEKLLLNLEIGNVMFVDSSFR